MKCVETNFDPTFWNIILPSAVLNSFQNLVLMFSIPKFSNIFLEKSLVAMTAAQSHPALIATCRNITNHSFVKLQKNAYILKQV
jgi:hypothetical protein